MADGVTVTVRAAPLPPKVMFVFGTSVVSDELPDTVKLPTGVSVSPIVNDRAVVDPSSLIVWLAIEVMVGTSFTTVTVTVNEVDAESDPSLAVSVMVDEPD